MRRKIVIPGGSGAVGCLLARHFHRRGDDVTVLTRKPQETAWRALYWPGVAQSAGQQDSALRPAWVRAVQEADIVINLAGRSVDCRYDDANRREIMNSRVDSTHAVGHAIATAPRPPRLWLNASTATIYRHVEPHSSGDHPMDEWTGELGGGEIGRMKTWKFSIDVATAWERAFFETRTSGVRKVAMRSALTAIPGVSWLGKLEGLARFGLGGTIDSGEQWVSWIHELDLVRAVEFLIEQEKIDGCVNLASPNPVPNAEFQRAIREAMGVSFGPRLPEVLLRFGAAMIGTEAELILKSRRVVPRRLLDAGFEFRFPTWPEAARELLWRPQARVGACVPHRLATL